MKFDLDDLDTKTLSEAGVWLTINRLNSTEPMRARTGEVIRLRVHGPDSPQYRVSTRKQIRRRLARSDAAVIKDADFDEIENDTLDMLASCTSDWENILDPDGKPIEFNDIAIRSLYENYPVIRDQVDAFIVQRANFIKASSKV